MPTPLVIHGHFYQPPRENPVDGRRSSASRAPRPYPRLERAHPSRVLPRQRLRAHPRRDGRVERIVNNYDHLSFNFGPTLLSWLERAIRETYARILDADRDSAGAPAATATPSRRATTTRSCRCCDERDRRTQVRWGLADFRHRFGRDAESLWLPETAADDATLARPHRRRHALRDPVAAPGRARAARSASGEWNDVGGGGIDARGRPTATAIATARVARSRSSSTTGRWRAPIAFEGALRSSQALVDASRRGARAADGGLVHVATDGESYGHHFTFGDLRSPTRSTVELPQARLPADQLRRRT